MCDECGHVTATPKRALPQDFAAEFRRKNTVTVMEAQEAKEKTEEMTEGMSAGNKETAQERAPI